MDAKQFHRRVRSTVAVLLVILVSFMWVLYDLQYVHGAAYLEQSRRKIARTETVEAARGQILDRYGRVLVTNRESYNVSLDTSFMGERQNEILLELLGICREEGVVWADTLPISPTAPFLFTFEDVSSGAVSNFQKLSAKMKWEGLAPTKEEVTALRETAQNGGHVVPVSADGLFVKLREVYGVEEDLPDTEARALIGVRYELALRAKEITWVSYAFAQDVGMSFIVKVKEASLPGVSIDTTTIREYNTTYAAHLLGRVGLMNSDEWENIYQALDYPYNASVGKDGMEQAFEQYLHGVPGKRAIETNDQGKVVSGDENWVVDALTGEVLAPQPGGNVITTLDIKFQAVVEQALADGIGSLKSEDTQGGAAVVIDVRDGGVLASASYPDFDLSQYSSQFNTLKDDPLKPLYNRAMQGLYPPASTFKMVTAIGALEEEIITTKSKINCTGIYSYSGYKNFHPRCWIYNSGRGRHGPQNVTDAIMNSCNIFFYDTGRLLNIERLGQYAAMFGLGQSTGIEVRESVGHVSSREYTASLGQRWQEGNVTSAAIGQENNQFTPLQLANYVATLANGGTHYAAHLLKEVKSNDFSEVLHQYEPVVLNELNLDPENLAAVTEGMLRVTTEGSAKTYFQDLGVQVAAKTGSAQVSSKTESNAVFVCFAPYENPEIAVAIVVEKGGSGATLAGIATEILEYYFSSGGGMESVELENTLLR